MKTKHKELKFLVEMTNNDKYIVTTDNTVNAFSSLQEAVEYIAKGLSYNYDQRYKAMGQTLLCRLEYDVKINEKLVDKGLPPGVS